MSDDKKPQPNWLAVLIVGGAITLLTNLATGAMSYAVSTTNKQNTESASTAVELRVLTETVKGFGGKLDKAAGRINKNAQDIAVNDAHDREQDRRIKELEAICMSKR